MVLSEQQVRFYNTFGYLAFRKLFSVDEMALLTSEFDDAMSKYGIDLDEGGQIRRHLDAPIEHSDNLCKLIDDERVVSIASALLGEDFNYAGGDGTYDAGDTSWHIDGNWGEHFAAKMIFFLDPVKADTGCLRVVPGSHRPDHHIRAYRLNPNKAQAQFGIDPHDFPGGVKIEADPGDLIIYNHDIYHALFGGSAKRREFTINLTQRCHNQVDLTTLRDYIEANVLRGRPWETMYTSLMFETATPARKEHLLQSQQVFDKIHQDARVQSA